MTIRRVWRGVAVAAAITACLEIACTVLAFATLRYRRRLPGAAAAQQLLLTRPVAQRLVRRDPRVAPYLGGRQRFLGELSHDSPEWIEMAPPDALLGTRNGRNITAVYENSIYATNDEGFSSIGARDFHYGLVRPPDCRRIIVVGGSTVFGWGAGTPDNNLPARLHHALEHDRSRCYEIINAGVPGYSSAQEFLFVASELIHYKPDLLIVYDGWNDQAQVAGDLLDESSPSPKLSGRTESFSDVNPLKSATHRTIEDRILESYSVSGSVRLALRTAGARLGAAIRRTGTYWTVARAILLFGGGSRGRAIPQYDPTSITRYRSNLAAMIAIAATQGIPIATFLQPLKWVDGRALIGEEAITSADAPYADARRAFYGDARTMLAGLAAQYGRAGSVCVEDISESVKNVDGNIYVDSGHLSGRGNDVVAAEIVTRLERCGILQQQESARDDGRRPAG